MWQPPLNLREAHLKDQHGGFDSEGGTARDGWSVVSTGVREMVTPGTSSETRVTSLGFAACVQVAAHGSGLVCRNSDAHDLSPPTTNCESQTLHSSKRTGGRSFLNAFFFLGEWSSLVVSDILSYLAHTFSAAEGAHLYSNPAAKSQTCPIP